MRLKLSLRRSGHEVDLLVTADAATPVGALARRLARSGPEAATGALPPVTLQVASGERRVLDGSLTLAEAAVRSGDRVSIVAAPARVRADGTAAPAAVLRVLSGPDARREMPLWAGVNVLGRDGGCDVRFADDLVSRRHARLTVGAGVEVVDLGSSNGVFVGPERVARAAVRPDDVVRVGDTAFQVVGGPAAGDLDDVAFNRSPRLDAVWEGVDVHAPKPPVPPRRPLFPWLTMLAPLLMGVGLFVVTRSAASLLFVALSPLMVVSGSVEQRREGKRAHGAALAVFEERLAAAVERGRSLAAEETAVRAAEHPAVASVVPAAVRRTPLLWSLRPDRRGFLALRIGLGRLASRNRFVVPAADDAAPALSDRLEAAAAELATVAPVPVVVDLPATGSLGVTGQRSAALGMASALVAQVVALHSPTDVVVAMVASSASARDWDWLRWSPHVTSERSPLGAWHLADNPGGALRLVAAVRDLVDGRAGEDGVPLPAVVLVVEDDAPVDRGLLVDLVERGRPASVYVLWVAPGVARLPAGIASYVEAGHERGSVAFVAEGRTEAVRLEPLDLPAAAELARSLAPVVDAGAPVDGAVDLPSSVSLLSLLGPEVSASTDAVADRWRINASAGRGEGYTLRAVVGVSGDEVFPLDLREHGPHALVGGTTGSGKSEFLQAWVAAMAVEHSPRRVNFLFVDYKGGAAFSDCVRLPHCVGLVTDLSPRLVQRALTSLHAELRHRERVLNARRAKDLLELERRGDPDAPPALVIVVDEFAALVKDVPEFVDGMVNIAQRGRSLGLHLVLATQRPAGVIKDNLRANTNLRIALRMADEDDSVDVVGSPVAAGFDPAVPGRAVAKTGPGRLVAFQTGYAGGWTGDEPPPARIEVEELAFGSGRRWPEPDDEPRRARALGPNDLHRIVEVVQGASAGARLPAPRRPWLDELAPLYELARMPVSRDDETLVFGAVDQPALQRQDTVAFRPDRDGHMAVFGTGGSGKSTLLRTLGVVAGLSLRGGPCHVYGIDFGARGLQMLEPLDHVGSIVTGDDDERIQRLLRGLAEEIERRAERYAAVDAGSVARYRQLAGEPGEARILLLLDGFGAFRQAYDGTQDQATFDLLLAVAAKGPAVGVHLVVTADRPGVLPPALASLVQRQVQLRPAPDPNGPAPFAEVFTPSSPPGRAVLDGEEIQVAVLGGTTDMTRQAAEIRALAVALRSASPHPPAPPVARLPALVSLDSLPVSVGGRPVAGIADRTLEPFAFVPEGTLVVTGPPGSGRTTAMATIVSALRRWRAARMAYLGHGRSALVDAAPWVAQAVGHEACAALAADLESDLPDVVVIEDVPGFLNGAAEYALLGLVKRARDAGALVLADGESSAMAAGWDLLHAVRAGRHGLALQPDQLDGEAVFRTPFPRINPAHFPPGRGVYVRGGTLTKVQIAVPSVGGVRE